MKYPCPVCGYPDLEEKPANHEICPSCGTQFGYDDYQRSHEDIRQEWLDNGAKWFLKGYEPYRWNAYTQLQNAGFLKVEATTKTDASQIFVDLHISDNSPFESKGVKVILRNNLYLDRTANQEIALIG